MLAWLVDERTIELHPVFDKSGRNDGTFSRDRIGNASNAYNKIPARRVRHRNLNVHEGASRLKPGVPTALLGASKPGPSFGRCFYRWPVSLAIALFWRLP